MTQYRQMVDNSKRQAGVEIEVTPEMIEAGVSELRALIGHDRWIDGDEDVVRAVFSEMIDARRAIAALSNDGYVIVPLDPTDAQMTAGFEATRLIGFSDEVIREFYAAMIEAGPKP